MSEDKPTTEMNVTQFVALGFRLCSIYCGYEVFRTSMDLIGAMQVLHLRPGSIVPPWAMEIVGRLSKLYTDTPGKVSTDIYHEIGIRFFEWLLWAFILWKGCFKLAHIVTEGLDKVN
jgi:hypothetical protein